MADQGFLDPTLPVTLHEQISAEFRSRIASGAWPPRYRLPSEPDLAAELSVGRGTLRRALLTLLNEGLLRRVPGKGTFVTSTTIEPAIGQKLTTLSEDFTRQGVESATEVLCCAVTAPPLHVAALLGVPVGGEVLCLHRRRITPDGPVALMHNYVHAANLHGIEDVDFEKESLFNTLETKYRLRISTARRTFSAEPANEMISERLGVPIGSPVQYLEQVTYLADGHPVEYSDVWIRSDRLRVTSHLSR